jgi:hypothetical protein
MGTRLRLRGPRTKFKSGPPDGQASFLCSGIQSATRIRFLLCKKLKGRRKVQETTSRREPRLGRHVFTLQFTQTQGRRTEAFIGLTRHVHGVHECRGIRRRRAWGTSLRRFMGRVLGRACNGSASSRSRRRLRSNRCSVRTGLPIHTRGWFRSSDGLRPLMSLWSLRSSSLQKSHKASRRKTRKARYNINCIASLGLAPLRGQQQKTASTFQPGPVTSTGLSTQRASTTVGSLPALPAALLPGRPFSRPCRTGANKHSATSCHLAALSQCFASPILPDSPTQSLPERQTSFKTMQNRCRAAPDG